MLFGDSGVPGQGGGQQLMLDDLGDIAELIEEADAAFNRVMMRLGNAWGLTDEAVDHHLQQMIDTIHDTDE